MSQRRSLGYLFLIIFVVVAPTVASLGWYQLSKNPSLRPLGITKQALTAYNGGSDGIEIVALVDWVPTDAGNYSQARLSRALTESFAAKGVELRIEFRPGQSTTRVTYRVGKTVLGPYSTARAAEGIAAAVEAYNMY
ncbi:MAG: hypothetical protein AUK37_08425 [Rhodobacterales bacterium CG2_30_65_12]|nr:MAG: hypothetical protein AUK37_08425 [Rhodobacterales bacterium CG2_30_65_12]